MRIANIEIMRSFEISAGAISGNVTLQVIGGENGFDENLIIPIRKTLGVLGTTPILEVSTMLLSPDDAPLESLLVLGVDVFDQAQWWSYADEWGESSIEDVLAVDGIVVSMPFAQRHNLDIGESITLLFDTETRALTIRGFIEHAIENGDSNHYIDGLAIMDIASAQYTFDRLGQLDHVGVSIDHSQDDVRQRLQKNMPSGISVRESSDRISQIDRLTRAFRVNLTVLSSVALLVGLFLIYNTITFSVIQRRREIGILRSLGMRRVQLMQLFIIEGLCIGTLGGVFGTILGLFMAKGVLYSVSATVSALYTPIEVGSLQIPIAVIPQGIGIAMVIAILGTIWPMRVATQINLVNALMPRAIDIVPKYLHHWKSGYLGIFLLCLGWGLTLLGPIGGIPVFGYLAMFLFLIGCAVMMPPVLSGLHRTVRYMGSRWPDMTWGVIAAARLDHAVVRSTITMGALMIGLAITIGVGVMIHSFRGTVENWIHETMAADIIAAPTTWFLQGTRRLSGTRETAGNVGGKMPDDLIGQVMGIAGIEAVDGYRESASTYQGYPITIIARDLVLHATRSSYLLLEYDSEGLLPEIATRGEVLVSESFSKTFNIKGGDNITLRTMIGEVDFYVADVFYDYAADGGRVLMDRTTYMHYWKDSSLNALAMYISSDADVIKVSEQFMSAIGRVHHLTLLSNYDLKQRILQVFDKTFAVTYALEVIAILVALLGITNALFASILERRRELAILRSIGGTSRQILRIFLWESGYLGSIGTVFGCVAGMLLAFVLVQVVNMQSFGWSIQLEFPFLLMGGAMLITFLISLFAGYVPAKLASRLSVTGELQYE